MNGPPLPPKGEIHLWVLEHQKENTQWLSKEELTTLNEYRFASDRNRYAFTQSCKRQILGHYLHTLPQDLQFQLGEFGKPTVRGLEFNISHSKGVSVLAVTNEQIVGVDIEVVRPQGDLLELAQHIMSADEWEAFQGIPEPDQLRAFYQIWTAKEAYLKNLGIGLQVEPSKVESSFPQLTSIKTPRHPSLVLSERFLGNQQQIFLATETSPERILIFQKSEIE